MEIPLLQTKFYIPFARSELVSRPRLIQKLNTGLEQSGGFARKLTLVSAPAGFGKTTLVSEWVHKLEVTEQPVAIAWLSLDESDNDPNRFLTYFITTLNRIEGTEPTFGKGLLSLIQSPQKPPNETVLTSLINEMAAVPGKIILVLDDYHQIDTQPIHDTLTFLLKHFPPRFHLVITTREDPRLPLARLRARGQMTELRATDLRFSISEAAEFLDKVMGLDLSEDDITALENRTEGWIAGLQLAAISMQGRKDITNFIESFTGSHRLVLDYLIEEVLEQQSGDIQRFLLHTSILNQLTGSLCDAVRFGHTGASTCHDNGQEILEMLDRANLFIVRLDEERRWYRYHHLFADLLRQRLRQTHLEGIPELHQRASQWYEQQGHPSDAIHHALAAKDFERAATLAEIVWPAWRVNFQSIAWLNWVQTLPDEIVRSRPVLSLAFAWAFLTAGKLEDAGSKMKDVERWLEPPDAIGDRSQAVSSKMIVVDEEQFQALPTSLATARAYHAQAIGDVQATVKYVGRVLELLPEDDHYNRAAVTGLLGLAYWASGDLKAAHKIFHDFLFQNAHDRIKGAFVLADMEMTLGLLNQAVRTCEHALRLSAEYEDPFPIGTEDVYTGISELHREQGNLETAVQDLALSLKLGEQIELPDWQHRWCIAQARLKVTRGDLDGALDLLDEAERLFVRTPVPIVRPIAAMKTRVWIKQGCLAEALTWVRERRLSVNDDLSYMREFEHVTLVRLLIARYKHDRAEDDINNAVELLDRILKAAEMGGRTGSVIEILVLQALAFKAQGKIPAALVSLKRALTLAAPEGFFRIFVDEGLSMADLLKGVKPEGKIMKDYVRKLLAAFSDKEFHPSVTSPQSLIEPLSGREIEVLFLIAEGLTNPEIATKLFLALNTVKVHTRNIYGKLGVNNRIQATSRARDLGILPSP